MGLRIAVCGYDLATAVDDDDALAVDVGTVHAPRCCLCGQSCRRQITRGKWPKLKHHPRCPPVVMQKQGETAAAAAAAPKQSHKRRADSDPGELPAQATPPAL